MDANMESLKRKCDSCGESFARRSRASRFCSKACHERGVYAAEHPRPEFKPCAECGESFRPKRVDSNFCSQPCRSRYYSQRYQGRLYERYSHYARLSGRPMKKSRERPLLREYEYDD